MSLSPDPDKNLFSSTLDKISKRASRRFGQLASSFDRSTSAAPDSPRVESPHLTTDTSPRPAQEYSLSLNHPPPISDQTQLAIDTPLPRHPTSPLLNDTELTSVKSSKRSSPSSEKPPSESDRASVPILRFLQDSEIDPSLDDRLPLSTIVPPSDQSHSVVDTSRSQPTSSPVLNTTESNRSRLFRRFSRPLSRLPTTSDHTQLVAENPLPPPIASPVWSTQEPAPSDTFRRFSFRLSQLRPTSDQTPVGVNNSLIQPARSSSLRISDSSFLRRISKRLSLRESKAAPIITERTSQIGDPSTTSPSSRPNWPTRAFYDPPQQPILSTQQDNLTVSSAQILPSHQEEPTVSARAPPRGALPLPPSPDIVRRMSTPRSILRRGFEVIDFDFPVVPKLDMEAIQSLVLSEDYPTTMAPFNAIHENFMDDPSVKAHMGTQSKLRDFTQKDMFAEEDSLTVLNKLLFSLNHTPGEVKVTDVSNWCLKCAVRENGRLGIPFETMTALDQLQALNAQRNKSLTDLLDRLHLPREHYVQALKDMGCYDAAYKMEDFGRQTRRGQELFIQLNIGLRLQIALQQLRGSPEDLGTISVLHAVLLPLGSNDASTLLSMGKVMSEYHDLFYSAMVPKAHGAVLSIHHIDNHVASSPYAYDKVRRNLASFFKLSGSLTANTAKYRDLGDFLVVEEEAWSGDRPSPQVTTRPSPVSAAPETGHVNPPRNRRVAFVVEGAETRLSPTASAIVDGVDQGPRDRTTSRAANSVGPFADLIDNIDRQIASGEQRGRRRASSRPSRSSGSTTVGYSREGPNEDAAATRNLVSTDVGIGEGVVVQPPTRPDGQRISSARATPTPSGLSVIPEDASRASDGNDRRVEVSERERGSASTGAPGGEAANSRLHRRSSQQLRSPRRDVAAELSDFVEAPDSDEERYVGGSVANGPDARSGVWRTGAWRRR